MKFSRSAATVVEHEVRVGACDLIELLRLAGVQVTSGAEVRFHTPGGGDWSNCSIDLDSDGDSGEQVVTVSWKVRSEAYEPGEGGGPG